MRGIAAHHCVATLLLVALAMSLAGCGDAMLPRDGPTPPARPRASHPDLERHVVAPTGSARTARCARPIEVLVYAQDDWLGLARTFAAAAPGCVEAWIGVPTIEGADHSWTTPAPHMKETFARIGANVHPLPTVDYVDWKAWGRAHPGVSWTARGAIAERRMAAAGYDVAHGDLWALNEVPLAVETDPVTRGEITDLLTGLQGRSTRPTGVAYAVIPVQADGSVTAQVAQVRPLLQDREFWYAADKALVAWSDEAYADVRNTCQPGTTYAQQADALAGYAYARRTIAEDAASGASPYARAMLARAVPLANAAWRWSEAYGWTDVPAAVMSDFLRVQIHAMARMALDWHVVGFAWAPRDAPAEGLAQIAATLRDELVTIAAEGRGGQPRACSWPGARIAG